jgi:predicted metal-dependent phosphotriesterase family hydrolase
MVFREGRRQGVRNMIATHAMDLAGKMNMDQMLEVAKLGVIIEFDFRNILSENGRRADAIRKIGPEHCLISEFWTNMLRTTPPPVKKPREYAGLDGAGAFAEAMRSRGFTDHELDIMFKQNPARLLGLSDQ